MRSVAGPVRYFDGPDTLSFGDILIPLPGITINTYVHETILKSVFGGSRSLERVGAHGEP